MVLTLFVSTIKSEAAAVIPDPEPVGDAPAVTNTYKSLSNKYVDVTFDVGVYVDDGRVDPVTAANFSIVDFVAGGVTDIAIAAVKRNNFYTSAGASNLIGGEYTVRIFLTLTGTPDSTESFRIRCTDIYSPDGIAATVNSATLNLNITPLILWDYLETGGVGTTGLGVSSIHDVMEVAHLTQATDADRPLDADGVVYFDRDNSEYLNGGDISALDFQKGTSFTIVVKRLRVLNSGNGGYIIACRVNNPGVTGWAIQTGADGSLFFLMNDGTLQGLCDYDAFNGSAERSVLFFVNNNGTLNIYDHEGNTLGTTGDATGLGTISYTGINLILGRRPNTTTSDLEGYWEKIPVVNKALTLAERNLYVANLSLTPATNYFDFESRLRLMVTGNITQAAGDFTWGNSVIKIGDTYHAYIERWDDVDQGSGYLYYGKIYYASSANRLGPFNSMTELTELKGPTGSAGAVFNAVPIVIGNTIYMYWCGTTAETPTYPLLGTPARNNMRIWAGYTSIDTPEGPFTILPDPILEPRSGEWDELMTTNPFPYIARDGSLKMVYKSCTIADPDVLVLGIAEATDPLTWNNASSPITSVTNIEESAVWREGEFYYMVTKGQDATYVASQNGILLYSKTGNADDWHLVTLKTRAHRLTTRFTDFSSALQGRIERPYILVEDGVATAFFTNVQNVGNTASYNIGRAIKPF